MDKKYTFKDFREIVTTLRSENGCPWDRVQTHESLKPCVMEEAAELVGAIRIYEETNDPENMQEELGDLLLQVVLHSEIASEEKLFTLDDVVDMVAQKMVRRHPHVFGAAQVEGAEQVPDNWEEIKKKEKEGKKWVDTPLREIPKELPALTRAVKIFKKVDKLYHEGKTYEESVGDLERIVERIKQIEPENYSQQLAGCVGDLLLAVTDICRQTKLTPEQILTDRIEDIITIFEPRAKL